MWPNCSLNYFPTPKHVNTNWLFRNLLSALEIQVTMADSVGQMILAKCSGKTLQAQKCLVLLEQVACKVGRVTGRAAVEREQDAGRQPILSARPRTFIGSLGTEVTLPPLDPSSSSYIILSFFPPFLSTVLLLNTFLHPHLRARMLFVRRGKVIPTSEQEKTSNIKSSI